MSADFRIPPAPRGRALALFLRRFARCVAFAVLLALPLRMSGVLHVVSDVIVTLAGHALHEGVPACPHEEDGERCPPDCASCHCVVAVPALLPAMPSVAPRRRSFAPPPGWSTPASLSPRLALPGLERPPRALRSFA